MRLGYVIVYVPDVAAALAFYTRAFGFERRFVSPGGEYGELETGATALGFVAEAFIGQSGLKFRPHRTGETPAATEIGLVTEDVEAAITKAIAAGATLAKPAERKPWGQIVGYVTDPNGVLIELCTAMGG